MIHIFGPETFALRPKRLSAAALDLAFNFLIGQKVGLFAGSLFCFEPM